MQLNELEIKTWARWDEMGRLDWVWYSIVQKSLSKSGLESNPGLRMLTYKFTSSWQENDLYKGPIFHLKSEHSTQYSISTDD